METPILVILHIKIQDIPFVSSKKWFLRKWTIVLVFWAVCKDLMIFSSFLRHILQSFGP
jgi:hypothetical protein